MLGFQRRDLDFGPQSRLGEGNWYYAMEIVPPTLEKRMLLHVKNHVEIAMGTAVDANLAESRKANARFVLDSGGHFRVNSLLLNDSAFAAALGAGIADYAARALAGRAGARNAKETLLIADLAAASATAAGCGCLAVRAAGALAGFTTLMPPVSDLGLGAERGFFEFNGDVFAKIGSPMGASAPPATATAAAKDVAEAEELTENITEILDRRGVEAAAAPT